jgi:hypothetical protein
MALAGDVREAERSTRALKPGRGRTESNGDSRSTPQRGSEAHPCCSLARSAAPPTTSASSCSAWPTRACPSPAGASWNRPACGRCGSGCPAAAPEATARAAWLWPGAGRPCCARCVTPAASPRPTPGCSSSPRWAASSSTCPTPPSSGSCSPPGGRGSTGATGRRAASWGACSGTSATPCSRSWPACPRARSTWPASPGASVPWSPTAGPRSSMAADPASGVRPSGRPPWPPGHAGRPRRPGPHVPSPSWFALTGTAPALVAAAAAMSGPELPPSLAAAAAN